MGTVSGFTVWSVGMPSDNSLVRGTREYQVVERRVRLTGLKLRRYKGLGQRFHTVDGGNLAPPSVPKVLGITVVQGP